MRALKILYCFLIIKLIVLYVPSTFHLFFCIDSPGFNINFESAPFKFTREYLEVMGGVDSDAFKMFQDLFLRGFLALQKHIDGITSIVQVRIWVQ